MIWREVISLSINGSVQTFLCVDTWYIFYALFDCTHCNRSSNQDWFAKNSRFIILKRYSLCLYLFLFLNKGVLA